MRKRGEIEDDRHPYEQLVLEVLLDLRELLVKAKPIKKKIGRPIGRPKKIK